MKSKFFSIVLLTGIMAMAACNNRNNGGEIKEPPVYSDDPDSADNPLRVLYPVEAARQDIANFDGFCRKYLNNSIPIKAYTVHCADLFAAMGMPAQYVDSTFCRFKHCRAYLGYDSIKGFKLFIVPVQGANLDPSAPEAGVDIMLNKSGRPVDTSNHDYKNQFVLDLNAPCPSICDKRSPLMQK